MKKTVEEINEKIRNGSAVILTAEEVSQMSEKNSPEEIFKKVDVVTTGTFGAMCSSGAFVNFGHADPPIRMEKVKLNNVPVSAGLAAVDVFIGASEEAENNYKYGGAHVIESLIKGEDVKLEASAKGTDCYPRKEIRTTINKNNVNEMYLYNPRNAYQNYPSAVNTSDKLIYTYMGNLLPQMGNVNYSTSGELSPLLNDPELRTIGIGTKVFLCGAQGFVSWHGTQFDTSVEKNSKGIPIKNSRTLALIGDMKKMDPKFIKAAYFHKYGVSIFIGVGIPIPILDVDIAKFVSIKNRDIETIVADYGTDGHPEIARTNYQELQSGSIMLNNKKIRTAPLSSISKARIIAEKLKEQIRDGSFVITKPVQNLPNNTSLNNLEIRGDE
ncbi:MAG: homocysteine biosynthesis protein [Candidatus Marinimicrobia bacterium]|nr:homocysteine biosynthesis protein [Candidatus Neomarinimicrobiota bacterium]